jgi:hypothetical protein
MVRSLLNGLGGLMLIVAILGLGARPAAADHSGVPVPHPVKAYKGEQCVEPADVMRRQHMNYLLHQRDETVRGGVRGAKYGLRQCIECHAIPADNAGGARTVEAFCSDCHEYAAVEIGCFQCHSAKAEPNRQSSLGQGWAPGLSTADRLRNLSALKAEIERHVGK